jgi:large subunit ribosomal protein L21
VADKFAGLPKIPGEESPMYAIVRDGCSQVRCEKGAKVRLALRDGAEVGSILTLSDVLLVGGSDDQKKVKVGAPLVSGASVTARVTGASKGPKLIVYRYRRRKNSDKKRGHRQHYTEVVIESIAGV